LGCDVLAARRIEKVDIGVAKSVNNQTTNFFLTRATINCAGAVFELNKKNNIEINDSGTASIINIAEINSFPQQKNSHPQDGLLELYIETNINKGFLKKETSQSYFQVKHLVVMSPKFNLILDNALEIDTPVEITALKKKINLIVGKERGF
jgi:hypothetical protein